MSVKQERYPFENFERVVRDPNHDDTAFAMAIGYSRDVIRNWRKSGIRLYDADRLACSLGYHLSYFWPEYWVLPEPRRRGKVKKDS